MRSRGVQVEAELTGFSPEKDTLLTIGVFDGVHLGHQRLITELLKQARSRDMLAGVITFRQHPEDLFTSGHKLPFLTDIRLRTKLLKDEGVDFIITLSFTKELAEISARQFLALLKKRLRMKGLVIGSDFALGKGREGNTDTLQKLGKELGITVTVVPPLELNGEVVSSTALRKALAEGDMDKIRAMTGRPFSLRGKVVAGEGRGEGLGFPTANLNVNSRQALPPDGVYAGLAHVNGSVYQAMTNIGRNPTFDGKERTIESFLVGYHGNLYGEDLQLDIIARLREEKKFSSADELKEQMARDVEKGKTALRTAGVN
jgi:riboflavin kinase/FMN adenylyltransferase